jgi:hypothetical protein
MTGPGLIIVGVIAGTLILMLLDYGRKKCKDDWCIVRVILAVCIVVIFALVFAVIG